MRRDRRGVALMLVLWLIVVLGTIAVGVAALVRGEANVVVNARNRTAARYAAESGIVAATWRLRELLRAAQTPRDQALVFRRLDGLLADVQEERLGGETFQVAVLDLSARIDLNTADEPMLVAFFGQFADARPAAALASALEDWRDDDDLVRPGGAEAADYVRAGSPFRPPNRPLQRLDELTRIKGFSDSLVDRIAEYVTVQGDGRINLNTAPVPVLTTLAGVGPDGARMLASQRDNGEVFTSLAEVGREGEWLPATAAIGSHIERVSRRPDTAPVSRLPTGRGGFGSPSEMMFRVWQPRYKKPATASAAVPHSGAV